MTWTAVVVVADVVSVADPMMSSALMVAVLNFRRRCQSTWPCSFDKL
jgi:hypothetical protein